MVVETKLFICQNDLGEWIAEDPWDINNRIHAKSLDALLKRLLTKTNRKKFRLGTR
jgi:hypothetical protein